MNAGDGWFTAADGTRLFRRWWRTDSAPRGILVNLHGLGDHSGLYPLLAKALPPLGWSVEAYDQRGSGHSPGRRGYVRRWQDWLDDLETFVQLIRSEQNASTPVVVMGHSLGGLVTLDWAESSAVIPAGVVAVAAPLGSLAVPRWLLALGRLASRVVPSFSLQTGLDLSGLSRDPAAIAAALADPLFHRRATARLAEAVPEAARRVQARAGRIRCPTLLLHGGADRMVPPDGSRAFAARAPALVTYREFPDAYHALFADLDAPAVLRELTSWLGALTTA